MLQNILSNLPMVLGIVVGVNVILGGIGQILHALNKSSAESLIGKISGYLKSVIDLISGNLPH